MKKYGFAVMVCMIAAGSVSASSVRMMGLGDISSNLDTKNIGQFPQRLMMSSQHMWLGADENDFNGGVRYTGKNAALQISGSYDDHKSQHVGEYVYYSYYDSYYDRYVYYYDSYYLNARNRINSTVAVRLPGMLLGGNVKFYSNSNEDFDDSDNFARHSIWYVSVTPGLTLMLPSENFLDLGIDFGTGGWSGESKVAGTDMYKHDFYEADGWFDFALNSRLYLKGEKIDIVPYASFAYTGSAKACDSVSAFTAKKVDIATMNADAGAGIHFRPSENVTVFNELEFRFMNFAEKQTDNDNDIHEDNDNSVSVLPTYRFGIESCYKIPERVRCFFDDLKLRAGFTKMLTGRYRKIKQYDGSKTELKYTSGDNEFDVSFGFALVKDNLTLEASAMGGSARGHASADIIFGF